MCATRGWMMLSVYPCVNLLPLSLQSALSADLNVLMSVAFTVSADNKFQLFTTLFEKRLCPNLVLVNCFWSLYECPLFVFSLGTMFSIFTES